MDHDRKKQLSDFLAYAKTPVGDEKGEAQIFLDRPFRALSRNGYKEAGPRLEDCVKHDRGGTSFADLVWKPILLIAAAECELGAIPGKNSLKDAHANLDAAVLEAYAVSPMRDPLKQLLDLNRAVARAIDEPLAVTAPGIPKSCNDPADLITDDCIKP